MEQEKNQQIEPCDSLLNLCLENVRVKLLQSNNILQEITKLPNDMTRQLITPKVNNAVKAYYLISPDINDGEVKEGEVKEGQMKSLRIVIEGNNLSVPEYSEKGYIPFFLDFDYRRIIEFKGDYDFYYCLEVKWENNILKRVEQSKLEGMFQLNDPELHFGSKGRYLLRANEPGAMFLDLGSDGSIL